MIRNYKDLEVWKRSVAFATETYRLTAGFPATERYGLCSQIRRAAISVAANIAEGWGRGSTREYVQFLTVARGSLMELETHLIIGRNLTYLTQAELTTVSREIEEIGRMLNGLMAALKSREEAA